MKDTERTSIIVSADAPRVRVSPDLYGLFRRRALPLPAQEKILLDFCGWV